MRYKVSLLVKILLKTELMPYVQEELCCNIQMGLQYILLHKCKAVND